MVTDGGRNVFYNSTNTGNDKRNITYDNKLGWKWKKKTPCKYNAATRVAEFYDGFFYFVYSVRTVYELGLPFGQDVTNTGWANFVSLFFLIADKTDPMHLMDVQRVLSIVLSVLTLIPAFFIFKLKFTPPTQTFVLFWGLCFRVFCFGARVRGFEPKL